VVKGYFKCVKFDRVGLRRYNIMVYRDKKRSCGFGPGNDRGLSNCVREQGSGVVSMPSEKREA